MVEEHGLTIFFRGLRAATAEPPLNDILGPQGATDRAEGHVVCYKKAVHISHDAGVAGQDRRDPAAEGFSIL